MMMMEEEEFDLEKPLGRGHLNDQMTSSLFDMESDHIPSNEYSQILKRGGSVIRHEAVSLITTHNYCCGRFSPYLSYLAITYLDRFLSAQGIPERKPWVSRILAISCVSLALKMSTSTSDPISSVDMLQKKKEDILLERKWIHRMELLILGVLKWRMRSVTPFCFMNFFVSMFKLRDPSSRQALKGRANEIIVKAQADVNLIEYKPSIIAASALLSACYTLFPLQFDCFKKAIYNTSNVDKEELVRCEDVVQEIAMEEYECILEKRVQVCGSSTTGNVLDREWSSSSSSRSSSRSSGGEYESMAVVLELRRDSKRRKT